MLETEPVYHAGSVCKSLIMCMNRSAKRYNKRRIHAYIGHIGVH